MDRKSVLKVRQISGMGIHDAKKALIRSNGDVYLAAGYLHYQSLAINVKNRPEWEERNAKILAEKLKEKYEAA